MSHWDLFFSALFIAFPRNNQVSYPLLPLQMLVLYLLTHYFFWHVSDFSWKMQSRVYGILQGHIHLFHSNHKYVLVLA